MLLDFLQQFFYAGLFFLGMTGVGYLILRSFGYRPQNAPLDLSLAYFTSLCLYTAFVVAGLFMVPDKRAVLLVSTIVYGLVSFGTFGYLGKKNWVGLKVLFYQHKTTTLSLLTVLVFTLFLFFLQIYNTAILDEWLHRPVVQSFVDTGVFPLVNPLSPGSDYIHGYHYGTQIIAAALQLVFRLDVPTSLDLLKLSYFVATLLLFYGLIFFWTKNRSLSLGGALLVLFAGSSFFFLDSFTASHLISFKGWGLAEGERWPINAALSYILTGITWVNIPLIIAIAVLFEQVSLGLIRQLRLLPILLINALFVGFYLISELFLVIFLTALVWHVFFLGYRHKQWLQIVKIMVLVSTLFIFGVYFFGGIVGDLIRDGLIRIVRPSNTSSQVPIPSPAPTVEPVNLERFAASFMVLRPVELWGYPSEKRILVIWDRPWYYLRTLMLEFFVLVLLFYAAYKKVFAWRDHPILCTVLIIGLVGPFFFSTMFWNINFAKITAASLVLLHLFIFYLIARLQLNKWLAGGLIGLLIIGAIPGLLMGSNIQWRWISSKGKAQFCSQNPICGNK